MKKLRSKLRNVVILCLIILLCGVTLSNAAKYTFRFGYPASGEVYTSENPTPMVPWNGFLTAFKNYVELESNGEIEIQFFPNGQLGGPRELTESINLGTVEMGLSNDAQLSNFVSEASCLNIPYLFSSETVAWSVLDGQFGQDLRELVEEKSNLKIIAFTENGFRNFTNNKKPIRTPEDMKGLKIRVMENPVYMKLVNSLGAKATPMPANEMYMALQQGVVDGQENPLAIIDLLKMYEVQKYLTVDGHMYGTEVIVMNKDIFYSLPKNLQEVILVSAERAGTVLRGLSQYWNLFYLDKFREEGMEIYFPTSKEKQMFKELSQKAVIDFVKKNVGSEWVDKIILATEKAEIKILGE